MEVTSTTPDFPVLGIPKLEDLTMGTFQMKQEKIYVTEQIYEDGEFEILVSMVNEKMLTASIQSKHSNRKMYRAIVTYNSETALEWVCQCPNGNQTIGCYSHITSLLWYLGYARHLQSAITQHSTSYIDSFIDAKSTPFSSSKESDSDNEILYSLA